MSLLASAAGSAWVASNVGGYWRFRRALSRPAETQTSLLARYLTANADTHVGRQYRFGSIRTIEEFQERVPLSSYADYGHWIDEVARGRPDVLTRDRVRSFALSSGSVTAAKRIPCTAGLQREFRRAIAPWIVDLYARTPALAGGCSYWSITPVAADRPESDTLVPVGFEEDSEYLGAAWKRAVDATLAVPGVVRFIRDIDAFRYV
ncbi:MAG TPA: GH3 auxin-responsive promoter family protein, partial [Vicinamibacterales bacterium]|nr:GH3 auxin-responsive promoter family protein [Vicinamibacterales bacterium]